MDDFAAWRAAFEKQWNTGPDPTVRALDRDPVVIDAISTGSLRVDRLTGIGGFPRGRITELFGLPGAGKTTLAYGAVREAQRQGLRAFFVDAERAFTHAWAAAQGVDPASDRFLLAQPEHGEQAFDIVEGAVRSGHFGLIVIDSLAALTPRKELEAKSIEENQLGVQARLITRGLRTLLAALATTNTALVMTNHLKEKVGVVYGDKRYRPGGTAADFFASLLLEVRRGEKIQQGKEVVGFTSKIVGAKNRYAAFTKEATEVRCDLVGGVSLVYDLLHLGLDEGVIVQRGSWYAWGDEKLGQGEEATLARLAADLPLQAAIREALA